LQRISWLNTRIRAAQRPYRLHEESDMSGTLRLPGDTRLPFGSTAGIVGRFQGFWRRLVAGLHVTPRQPATRASAPVTDDDGVFALQCAEAKARIEFDEAMEVWASQT
jgi:hypothetical protein